MQKVAAQFQSKSLINVHMQCKSIMMVTGINFVIALPSDLEKEVTYNT